MLSIIIIIIITTTTTFLCPEWHQQVYINFILQLVIAVKYFIWTCLSLCL